MAAVFSKPKSLLNLFEPFLSLQKFKHTMAHNSLMEKGVSGAEQIDMSKWRKMDSRNLGIGQSMISEASWVVLKVLQSAGYDAYLVGGCVRDMLLNKVPKDFDVITTAALKQVKKKFHRCLIVGSRFPICLVHVKGSVIEVSSFETVARHNKEKEHVSVPRGCNMKDYALWRNCMLRDFTVNSLFFDPFERKVYDYANGMTDLKSSKLRTLIPAHLSFGEDCARILRGLRLAARLDLSLSQETEIAIRRLVPSIANLPKARIMMEMNYMLSYGAAEPSLSILEKFKLLEILLPLHAAYLSQQARNNERSVMLMKLFHNLDKLVTCDQPSECNLWIGLLAFHLALVLNPQDALVVRTFASVLYYGNWKEGVKFGREHAHMPTVFIPEITQASHLISDGELAERVSQLASKVQYCLGGLSHSENLHQLMTRFPTDSPCSGLVYVPYKSQKRASDLFYVLEHDVESYEKERKCFNINYSLLGKGDMFETRFVLGKIILDTMSCPDIGSSGKTEEKHEPVSSDSEGEVIVSENKNRKRGLPPHITEPPIDAKKNKKMTLENCCVSEVERTVKKKKASNKEFNPLANLKLKEKNEDGSQHTLQFVEEKEHPRLDKGKQQEGSKPKLIRAMKKVNEKNKDSIQQTLQLAKDKEHPNFEKGKQQEGSEAKLVPAKKKVIEKNIESIQQMLQLTKDDEHPKSKNGKRQEGSGAKMTTVMKNVKHVINSVEKSNLPQDMIKKLETVSENSRVSKDKTEKAKEGVKREKHKQPSLSSLFRR